MRAYDTENGFKASTTGTVHGIYDLRGCTYENLAAYVETGNDDLNNGSNIISAEAKYKDVYAANPEYLYTEFEYKYNYDLSANKYGDAVYETSNAGYNVSAWFYDDVIMPSNEYASWFVRGGSQNDNYGIFNFYPSSGSSANNRGFRPVLMVEDGL